MPVFAHGHYENSQISNLVDLQIFDCPLWTHTGCTVMCINEMWDITWGFLCYTYPQCRINQNG